MSDLSLDRVGGSDVESLQPQTVPGVGRPTENLGPVWIVEEASGHLRTQGRKGPSPQLRLYKLNGDVLTVAGETNLTGGVQRPAAVISMLRKAGAVDGVLVCSHRAAAVAQLAELLEDYGLLHYVLEADPARSLEFDRARDGVRTTAPKLRAENASWRPVRLSQPAGSTECFAANLGTAALGGVGGLTCFALSVGGIDGYQRGILIGMTSLTVGDGLKRLSQLLAWTRWIRLTVRRAARSAKGAAAGERRQTPGASDSAVAIKIRANRRLASEHDLKEAEQRAQQQESAVPLRARLTEAKETLNVVELFAGAGGMGLGFLRARSADGSGYRIAGSAEIHPIYTQTLRQNHTYMERAELIPSGSTPSDWIPMDLCSPAVRTRLAAVARERGEVDVVIGGPPCQGFSSANRNSWSSSNPNNKLVDAFMDSVSLLQPKVLLMENVQGILWTSRDETSSGPSVASHVLKRLKKMGYQVFPKLLDAVWYGAPQNRNRFFLLGLHQDLGYHQDDFGAWGPFPRPSHGPGTSKDFVTVQDAIRDLPRIANGEDAIECSYAADPARVLSNEFLRLMREGAPEHVMWDHVTSRHADYVIDRYKLIPQGKNWEAVRHLMTNYADVERTHSNIYRRLDWREPAITMGHYRKSMIIHPSQNRGLSLREASRLQTFPDWFRFAGSEDGNPAGGLIHKQQQLANAVCPNVTKAVAEFILGL
ncbi:DNA-cytosine methyltransferase [plant metagenome]|uniref:DNA (cytosine-5-)-methyltransferase n=1 Tax=plant metagenome TaxID=1297885 RepID=A0A484PZW5_9ZZZZ